MRECHLTQSQRRVLLDLFQKLFTQLQWCHMARQIVKVDSCSRFLAKLDTFYPYLIVRMHRSNGFRLFSCPRRFAGFGLELVDAVILFRFVSLCNYYLLDWTRSHRGEIRPVCAFSELHKVKTVFAQHSRCSIADLGNFVRNLVYQLLGWLVAEHYARSGVHCRLW